MPCTNFKPQISRGLLAVSFAFIAFGIVFTILAFQDGNSITNLFPLIFTIYGVIFLIKLYTTVYLLDDDGIKIRDAFSNYAIPYQDVIEAKVRKINLGFRHGTKGRIRSETCADTVFITASKPVKNGKCTIIISPADREKFMGLINERSNLQALVQT